MREGFITERDPNYPNYADAVYAARLIVGLSPELFVAAINTYLEKATPVIKLPRPLEKSLEPFRYPITLDQYIAIEEGDSKDLILLRKILSALIYSPAERFQRGVFSRRERGMLEHLPSFVSNHSGVERKIYVPEEQENTAFGRLAKELNIMREREAKKETELYQDFIERANNTLRRSGPVASSE